MGLTESHHPVFLSRLLPDENKDQSSFFVPESETVAPDYWRESSGTISHSYFVSDSNNKITNNASLVKADIFCFYILKAKESIEK